MMGGVSPEICLASCKYGIIKFRYIVASCWIFLYELCQSDTDAWEYVRRCLVDVIQMLMCFDDWNKVSVSRKCKR